MSKPSFSNIDQWLFELAEGSLSPSQQEQLELFILQHPELEAERDAWEMARVLPVREVYAHAGKHKRRKPVGAYMAMGLTACFIIGLIGLHQVFRSNENVLSSAQTAQNGSGHSMSDVNERNVDQKDLENLLEKVAQLDSENKRLAEELAILSAVNNTNASQTNSSVHKRSEYSHSAPINDATENASPVLADLNDVVVNQNSKDVYIGFADDDLEKQPVDLNDVAQADKDAGLDLQQIYEVDGRETPDHTETSVASTLRFESQEISLSFKSKMNRMMRSVQRMMDNPVALKNTRDPQFHLPGLMPLDVNSSAAGTLLTTRVQTLSRLQWLGTSDEQWMNGVALDGYSFGMRGGIGLQLQHSMYNNGGIHNGQASLSYSPKFSVSRVVSVEPSIRLKMGAKTLDHQKMSDITSLEIDRGNVYDYYPAGTDPLGKTLFYKDVGLGLMINTKWFFVGVQGDNLLRHKDNLYDYSPDKPRRAANELFVSLGTDWENQRESLTLSPYLIYHKNEQLNEAWLGLNMRWGWATMGIAASSKVDLGASVGLKFEHFSLSYQADYTKNTHLNKQLLSHQLSLRFLTKMSKHGQRILNL